MSIKYDDDDGDIELTGEQADAIADVMMALVEPYKEHGAEATEAALEVLLRCGVAKLMDALVAASGAEPKSAKTEES